MDGQNIERFSWFVEGFLLVSMILVVIIFVIKNLINLGKSNVDKINTWLWVYYELHSFQLFVGCLGIVGNILSIIWFSRKIMLKNFHRLMLALAAFDLLYICLSITIFSLPSFIPSLWANSTYLHMIPIILPMAQVGLSGSIYFTLAIAVERYTTVCHPFWKVRKLINRLLTTERIEYSNNSTRIYSHLEIFGPQNL